MNSQPPEPVSAAACSEVIGKLFKNHRPLSEEAYRARLMTAEIFPTIERWGFERRFQCTHPEMHPRQLRMCERVREKLARKGAIIAMVGERGLGKTTVAAQLAIEQALTNHREATKPEGPRRIEHFIYRKCAKIVTRYKPLFADFGSIETDSLLESLDNLCRNQEFLVIDELHECDDMKFKRIVITDLIDRRYANCRDTILIANQTGEEFAATIGDSILSRLEEHGAILECKWPSYRSAQP